MFYLTTHSTHFIYGYMASDMVMDHLHSEIRNPLPPHGLLFPINSKGSFICTSMAHTTAFVTPVVKFRTRQNYRLKLCQADISNNKVTCQFISIILIRLVLYLKKIILSKICIFYCFVLLNSILS